MVLRASLQDFVEPDWEAPVDAPKTLAAIPESATIRGMFLEPLAREARRLGTPLKAARPRYTTFRFYPLREHVQLLIEACDLFYHGRPMRTALRKVGRQATDALLLSTYGRVSVGAAQTPLGVLEALAKTYPVNMPGCQSETLKLGEKSCLVRLQGVRFFLDSHHVGVFEGAMRYSGTQGDVKIRTYGSNDADLLCAWK